MWLLSALKIFLFFAVFSSETSSFSIEILRDETDTLMAQLGLRSIDEIGPQIFWSNPD